MMKRFVVLAALIGGLSVSAASAADLGARPIMKAAPIPVAVSNWTGFYIGAHAGYGWGRAQVTPTFGTAFSAAQAQLLAASGSPSLDTHGGLGGLQAGFNIQSGNFVWGIEADASYSGIRGSRATPLIIFPGGSGLIDRSFSEEDRLKWLSTVRGRVGYATPDLLIYVTGGLAIGRREFSQFIITDPAINFNNLRASVSETRAGWTAGGGLEYALSRNWSVKAEYL